MLQYPKFIGLGAMMNTTENVALNVIRYAISLLKNNQKVLIDTARAYGNNEIFLSNVLNKLSLEEINELHIVTKIGIKEFSLETENPDHSLYIDKDKMSDAYVDIDELRNQWTISKNLLNPNTLLLHRRHYNNEEYMKQLYFLKELVYNEQIDSVGLSEVSLKDLKLARNIIGPKMCFLQTEFSMHVRFLIDDGYLDYCNENNIVVMGYSPTGRGFWTDEFTHNKLPLDWRTMLGMWQNFDKLSVYLDKVRELSKNLNIKTVQLALWWILQNGVIPIAGSNDYNRNIINLNSFVLTLPNNIKNELDIIIETMPTNVTTKNFNNNDRIKRYK